MNLRKTLREIAEANPYRDPDGRLLLRVTEPWTSPVYDRRGKPMTVKADALFAFDLEEMQVRCPDGFNYVPTYTREQAADCSKATVAVWDMIAHVLTHNKPVTGPDSFAAVGIDPAYAPEILAVLLARGAVNVEQIRSIYEHITDSCVELPEHTWAWG